MNTTYRICILGGTGFVGQHLTRRLTAQGHQVTVISRRRERHRELLVLPTVSVVDGDVHDPSVLTERLRNIDVVINLIGILNERGHRGHGFLRAHAELPRKIADACQRTGVRRLLHMSALNADENGPSHYLRSKGIGEKAVHAAHANDLRVTSFRPSVIFGKGDSFTLRFAALLRNIPWAFPLACPDAVFQPIYIDDVVTAFVNALSERRTYNHRYNLCGPKRYTLYDIVHYISVLTGERRHIVALNPWLSQLQATMMEFVPGKPFSKDNFDSMRVDSVCDAEPAPELQVTPRTMEEVVPGYIRPQSDPLSELRRHARR